MTRFYSFLLLFSATLGQINCQAVYLRLDDRPHTCAYWQWPPKKATLPWNFHRILEAQKYRLEIFQNGSSEILKIVLIPTILSPKLEIRALLWNFDLVPQNGSFSIQPLPSSLSRRTLSRHCSSSVLSTQLFEEFSEKEKISLFPR